MVDMTAHSHLMHMMIQLKHYNDRLMKLTSLTYGNICQARVLVLSMMTGLQPVLIISWADSTPTTVCQQAHPTECMLYNLM